MSEKDSRVAVNGVDFDPADGRQGEQPDARIVAHVRKAVCH